MHVERLTWLSLKDVPFDCVGLEGACRLEEHLLALEQLMLDHNLLTNLNSVPQHLWHLQLPTTTDNASWLRAR